MVKVNPTDKLVFDLEMFQIDFNEQKKESLRKEISEKYGVPLKNVEVNFVPVTVDDKGDKISLASDIITNIRPVIRGRSRTSDELKRKTRSLQPRVYTFSWNVFAIKRGRRPSQP